MLRDAIKAGTDVGLKAKDFVENGALVPDEVMVGVILARLQEQDCKTRGWLLDGFPRTPGQAEALKAANITCDVFLQLDVSQDLLLERVIGRRLDPVTGKIYHLKYSPPETEEIRARLTQRADDTEEKFKTRIDTYLANTGSILSMFADKLVTLKVDSADQTPAKIYETIKRSLASRIAVSNIPSLSSKVAASSSSSSAKASVLELASRTVVVPPPVIDSTPKPKPAPITAISMAAAAAAATAEEASSPAASRAVPADDADNLPPPPRAKQGRRKSAFAEKATASL